MTHVPMTLTQGQSQIFPKMGKKTQRTLEAISPTDFLLGTKVQPNKAHSMTQMPMPLIFGQDKRSRSNFPKNA